jgi:DNA helicase-2/ATP-dependent DNA helicase PcrA
MPNLDAMLEHLNAEQRQAVLHDRGPLLVVAGAGTGKTRVITARIAWLLQKYPDLSGENILGLTFTDKAASEMKSRVIAAVGERGASVELGTFHSFCYKLLRDVNPGLKVLDPVDHWILLRRHLPELQLVLYKRLAEPGQFLGDFVKFFSRCQDELVSPDDYDAYVKRLEAEYAAERDSLDADARAEREAELARQQELARAYRVSEALLRENNYITYGGQLLGAVRLLQTNAALREKLRQKFRYILVDEFQDTNIAQIELLDLLSGPERNIVAVGDDDQAIYRFRGASFGSFQLFRQKFLSDAETGSGKRLDLPLLENYRSTRRILRVSGAVIQCNLDRYIPNKQLRTANPEGEKIQVAEFASAEEEAQWVAEEMERLHERGLRWREFAVLYRIHAHRELLVKELTRRGIPFVIRNRSILNNPLVRDVLAYLRLIATPSDNVACARVLAAPAWGFEASDLVRLGQRAESSHRPLWFLLDEAQGELPFSAPGRRTRELLDFIGRMRHRARTVSAAELFDELVAELGLILPPDDANRPAMERLGEFIREWEHKPLTQTGTLDELVRYLDDFEAADGQIQLPEPDIEDAVRLMTVHAAKGLEFDHVFVIRLVMNSFPVRERRPVLEFPAALMKEELPQGNFHIQEERRLFYVALTRARRRLTLTTVIHRRSRESEFLKDFLSVPSLKQADVVQLKPRVTTDAAPRPPAMPDQLFGAGDPNARAYSRIGRWAAEFHPPTPNPLRLSDRGVETYQSCPQKYLFSQVWGLEGMPRAAQVFGRVMHTTISRFLKEWQQGRPAQWEDLEATYHAMWRDRGFEDDYQREEYKKEGLEQLRQFYADFCAAPPQLLFQERTFELPLENDLIITGRIDQINRLTDSAHEILDYKTGKPKAERDARLSLQMNIYAHAAREVLELSPARLTFYNLMSATPASAECDPKQLQKTLDTVREVSAEIRAGNFAPESGYHCRFCDFRLICPAHEQDGAPPGET